MKANKRYINLVKILQSDKVLFGSAFFLMSLIFTNHFLSLINFTLKLNAQIILFPVALTLATIAFIFLAKNLRLAKSGVLLSFVICVLLFTFSFFIASVFYDFSWDGLWYHQAGIYFLKEGWNPLYAPNQEFTNCAADSVLHFAKGPWYFAANIFSTFGDFEAAKSINLIVMFVVYFVVYATAKDYNLSTRKSVIIGAMITLNPVIINELLSFLVDQLLISYLIIYVVAFIKWLKDKSSMSIVLAIIAASCLINTKFTGLVYFVIASFFMLIYLILNNKFSIKHIFKMQFIALAIGVFVFGFNPYVTNTIHWGHPFYPIINPNSTLNSEETVKYDFNEQYETPKNMVGKSTFYRFFYATFSRPGNAPFNDEMNAKLMMPYSSSPSDWLVYRYHEARVSGFGPFFSGILILSFILTILVSIKRRKTIQIIALFSAGILVSIFLNKHFWIPRFAPQLWYLPIIPLIITWLHNRSKRIMIFSYLITLQILLNSLIVSYVHFNWEKKSTDKLNSQLVEIKDAKSALLVHSLWFKKSIKERLNVNGIEFEFVEWPSIEKMDKTELQTIVDRYPGKVFFIYKE